jgi:hypothetical protein
MLTLHDEARPLALDLVSRCVHRYLVKKAPWIGLASLLVTLAVVVFMRRSDTPSTGDDAREVSTERSVESTPRSRVESKPRADVSHDANKARELREAILRALAADAGPAPRDNTAAPTLEGSHQRTARGTPSEDNPTDGGLAGYAKSIQARVREDLLPMAGSCYEILLAKRADAGGTIMVEFEIIHDETLGGVVNEPLIGDGGTLRDDELSTCIRESLSNISFEAPPGKGRVTIKYPLTLAPEDPDDAG